MVAEPLEAVEELELLHAATRPAAAVPLGGPYPEGMT